MQLSTLRQIWPFQALADATRFRIVRLLATHGAPVRAGEVARALSLPANHLSKHLQLLELSGLIARARRGKAHYLHLCVAEGPAEYLYAAVRSAADLTGLFAIDSSRLLGAESPAEGE